MSMFNRNVKLQFNRMKYAPLLNENSQHLKHNINRIEGLRTRLFAFTIGFGCALSMINFDATMYTFMKGVNRWKHRLEATFGIGHHGAHGHDAHGHGHDSHGHSDKHDSHNSHAAEGHGNSHDNHAHPKADSHESEKSHEAHSDNHAADSTNVEENKEESS